jgi:hypothetical protein
MFLIFGPANMFGKRAEVGAYDGGRIYSSADMFGKRAEVGAYDGGQIFGPADMFGKRAEVGAYDGGKIFGPADMFGKRAEVGAYDGGKIFGPADMFGKRAEVGAYNGDPGGGAASGLILLLLPRMFMSARAFPVRAPADPEAAQSIVLFAVEASITEWGGVLYGNWTADPQAVCQNTAITGISKNAIVSGQEVGACQNGTKVIAVVVQLSQGRSDPLYVASIGEASSA